MDHLLRANNEPGPSNQLNGHSIRPNNLEPPTSKIISNIQTLDPWSATARTLWAASNFYTANSYCKLVQDSKRKGVLKNMELWRLLILLKKCNKREEYNQRSKYKKPILQTTTREGKKKLQSAQKRPGKENEAKFWKHGPTDACTKEELRCFALTIL